MLRGTVGHVRGPSSFAAKRQLNPDTPIMKSSPKVEEEKPEPNVETNLYTGIHSACSKNQQNKKKIFLKPLFPVIPCLTFFNHFVCVRACVRGARVEKSKENSRVFSLEFAHTAHTQPEENGDYLPTNHVLFCVRRCISSHTRPTPSSSSSPLNVHNIVHMHTHVGMHMVGRKHRYTLTHAKKPKKKKQHTHISGSLTAA